MKLHLPPVLFLSALLALTACTQGAGTPSSQSAPPPQASAAKTPQITLTRTRVVHPATLEMRGSGFTPKRDAKSHLKRVDGTEFPVLNLLADERGEFVHEVESLLLDVGTHELWVFDETTGTKSNVAKFEVVRE